MSHRALVVPTNRPDCLLRFLEKWKGKGGWDHLIVVEDAPTRTLSLTTSLCEYAFSEHITTTHFSHKDIDRILQDKSWIISRGDSAIRCFGFLAAYWSGAEYVMTLDDDCYPHQDYPLIFNNHVTNLNPTRWTMTAGRRTRGIPYVNMGRRDDVWISMGLWTGVPDLDAKSQMHEVIYNFVPPTGHRILAKHEYAPICGMNLCVRRSAIPLLYFPLMGKGQPYRRFDDIWMGIIAKKICDNLNLYITVGEPWIFHSRASDVHKNLERESPGMAANEYFWRVIDEFSSVSAYPADQMTSLGSYLGNQETHESYEVGLEYLNNLGKAIVEWSYLFVSRPEEL